jgi:hypothetical protein
MAQELAKPSVGLEPTTPLPSSDEGGTEGTPGETAGTKAARKEGIGRRRVNVADARARGIAFAPGCRGFRPTVINRVPDCLVRLPVIPALQ